MFFIVNPIAGSGRAQSKFARVREILDAMGVDYSYELTRYKGHALDIARQAVERGEKLIVSVGGDGTVNEVAEALCGADAVLGLLPFGTGNDLARPLGIPTDPEDALNVLLAGTPRRMDAGMVNSRFFLNVSGIGFDVEVLINTERYKKKFNGMFPYLLGILRSIFHPRTLHLTLRANGREWQRNALILSVGNGTHIGGGMKAVPNADPFDGLLDISTAEVMSIPRFIALLPGFIKGTHIRRKEMEYFRTEELFVECPEMCLANIDGEVEPVCAEGAEQTAITFRVLPKAVQILMK